MVNTLGPETESALLLGFLPYSRWSSFWRGGVEETRLRLIRELHDISDQQQQRADINRTRELGPAVPVRFGEFY